MTHNLVRKKWFENNGQKKRKCKIDVLAKPGAKVLLKIKAGKSMTIISPSKSHKSKEKKKNKKMKKKHRKEMEKSTESNIVLSIKKGSVTTSVKPSFDSNDDSCGKTVYKVEEPSGSLKLKIKAMPDLKPETVSSHVSEKNDTWKDKPGFYTEMKDTVEENNDFKSRNGIVIVKDKKGKFSAEQLHKSPRKKDRENVFDSLKSVGMWRVMPSPRPDGGIEGLKLKLSPHKPQKVIENSDDLLCLDSLDVKAKTENRFGDLLPAYYKESEANVNDSGIETEVLSSSSYNRSNGNSVRSVTMDENSPSYFNTDGDSVISVDSPYMDNFNKSEHSICTKCGGIIIDANSFSNSPRKCRCSISNPNSPFQTPLSPVKLSDIHPNKHTDITVATVEREKDQSCHSVIDSAGLTTVSNDKVDNCDHHISTAVIDDNFKIVNSEGEDSDVMIIDLITSGKSCDSSSPQKEFKGKLKLKIRPPKNPTLSPQNRTVESAAPIQSNEKQSHEANLELDNKGPNKVCADINHVKSVGISNSSITADKLCNVINTLASGSKVGSESTNSYVGKGSVSSPLVLFENDDNSKVTTREKPENKLCKKKPLFKAKPKSECLRNDPNADNASAKTKTVNGVSDNAGVMSTSNSLKNGPDSTSKKDENKTSHSMPDNKKSSALSDSKKNVPTTDSIKKPIFKKRSLSNEKPEKPVATKKPLFKKQKSMTSVGVIQNDKQSKDNKNESDEPVTKKEKRLRTVSATDGGERLNEAENEKHSENLDSSEKSSKPTLPQNLNLFQQQFLSFLSNSAPKDTKDSKSKKGNKENNENKALKVPNELVEQTGKGDNNDGSNESLDLVTDKTGKRLNSVSEEMQTVHSKKKNGDHLKHSDSFSWLRIFSDAKTSETDKEKSAKDSYDVMTDLSADLASINQKMDDSDDDTNSLDMDDIFKADHLSSLQPKVIISRPESGSAAVQPRRRQKAKRTGTKVSRQIKKKIELDYKYYDSSDNESISQIDTESDPEFNPYDSDDDFVSKPNFRRRSSVRSCSKTKHFYHTSDSEENSRESFSDAESRSSKHAKRLQGRKSCHCCSGAADNMERTHRSEKCVRMPRNYKQFVNNTTRLLTIQKKLVSLFEVLFPDCLDMLASCKVGTEEFDALLDDVISGLEQPDQRPDQTLVFPPGKNVMTTSYPECQVNNIGLSFTSPDSVTRTSEIDFMSNEDKKYLKPPSTIQSSSSPGSDCTYSSGFEPYNQTLQVPASASLKFNNNTLASDNESEGAVSPYKCVPSPNVSISPPAQENSTSPTPGKPFSNQTSSLLLSVATAPTSVSMLNSNSGPSVSHVPASFTVPTPSQHPEMGQLPLVPFESDFVPGNDAGSTRLPIPIGSQTAEDPLGLSGSSGTLSYHGSGFYPVAPQPLVNITIDLNAARVTLCKSPECCLHNLQDRVVKLMKLLVPSVELTAAFFKNINNIEFLIDLLVAENKDRELKNDSSEEAFVGNEELVTNEQQNWCANVDQTLLVPQNENLVFIPIGTEGLENLTESNPLFVACSDIFEQDIKSRRELLRRDLFDIEEDNTDEMWKSSEDKVLNSIASLNNIARSTRSPKKRTRDNRPRKRSADEKRTLFVQEKIQNTHNSSFVCHTHDSVNKITHSPKKSNKRRFSENSKERFLSELDLGLGDKASIPKAKAQKKEKVKTIPLNTLSQCTTDSPSDRGDNPSSVTSNLQHVDELTHSPVESTFNSESQSRQDPQFMLSPDSPDSMGRHIDNGKNDLMKKNCVEKNIFELMLPV